MTATKRRRPGSFDPLLLIAIVATALVLGYGLLFLVFVIAGGEGADSRDAVGTGRGVSVDLHGRGSAEDWVIVLDPDLGLTEGLVSAFMTVSANGGLPGLPGVEIKPGPPIEDGEPFLHGEGDGHHSVKWPFWSNSRDQRKRYAFKGLWGGCGASDVRLRETQ